MDISRNWEILLLWGLLGFFGIGLLSSLIQEIIVIVDWRKYPKLDKYELKKHYTKLKEMDRRSLPRFLLLTEILIKLSFYSAIILLVVWFIAAQTLK